MDATRDMLGSSLGKSRAGYWRHGAGKLLGWLLELLLVTLVANCLRHIDVFKICGAFLSSHPCFLLARVEARVRECK